MAAHNFHELKHPLKRFLKIVRGQRGQLADLQTLWWRHFSLIVATPPKHSWLDGLFYYKRNHNLQN